MTTFQKALIVLAVAAMLIGIWLFRFTVIPVSTAHLAYRLDRWTGEVYLVDYEEITKIVPAKKSK